MTEFISPKYLMELVKRVEGAIWAEYRSYKDVSYHIKKWYKCDEVYGNWENFTIVTKNNGEIDLLSTLHTVEGEILLQIAVDLGVETPDFIPSVAYFRNEIKSDYKTASATFEKAFKQIETHPDIAIGLANSALESIIKEIFKEDRIVTRPKECKTLYDLTCDLLKEFKLYPNSEIPAEIKTIGSSLLSINQSIEKLRSTKTTFHGKTNEDYYIEEVLYSYFIINSVATVGLFLKSFYIKKFPNVPKNDSYNADDLPF